MVNCVFFDQWYDDFLEHSGVKGMKHGVRNYQYPDGTWTELGKERRRVGGHGTRKNIDSSSTNSLFFSKIKDDLYAVNDVDDEEDLTRDKLENCAYCSVAYELRRRGYDATAKESHRGVKTRRIGQLFGEDDLDSIPGTMYGLGFCNAAAKEMFDRTRYPNGIDLDNDKTLRKNVSATSFTKKEVSKIERKLIKQGNGARGIITTWWSDGNLNSGHFFNYEIANSKVYLIDSQQRIVQEGLGKDYLENSCAANYIRTDNRDIDIAQMSRFEGSKIQKKSKAKL